MARSLIGTILRPAYGLADRLHLNFFRIHLIWFMINPIFWSIILYVSSGEYAVSYIDSLFLCTSAHTVTGLSTMNLSTLTGFQQAILFYLMCVGNYTIVSLVMVIVRKHYFIDKVLKSRPQRATRSLGGLGHIIRSKTTAILGTGLMASDSQQANEEKQPGAKTEEETIQISSSGRNPRQIKGTTIQTPREQPAKEEGELVPPVPRTGESGACDVPADDPPSIAKPQSEPNASDSAGVSLPLALTLSPKMSPNVLADGSMYRTESPSAISEHTSPRSMFHPSGQVNFAVPLSQTITTRSKSSRAPPLSRRPTIGHPGTTIVTASPGPRREGTGLFFSSVPTSPSRVSFPDDTNIREVASNVPPQQPSQVALEPLGPFDPQLQATPSYERRFGGFPGPLTLGARLAQHIAPTQYAKLKRKLTIDSAAVYAPATEFLPQTETSSVIEKTGVEPGSTSIRKRRDTTLVQAPDYVSVSPTPSRPPLAPPHLQSINHGAPVPPHLRFERPSFSETDTSTGILTDIGVEVKRTVLYLKDGILKVGRNSAFLNTDEMTDEQLEELGGIEYRALRALTWIVALYLVGTQMTMFIIFVIYLYTTSDYDTVFESQPKLVSKAWFSAFQAVSSYTGGGLTLVDQGMGPFAAAYVMVIFQGWLIVAGSLGLPIFLRLIVWILCKFVPVEHKAPLQFLLDHPRRCYLYLFPSHQTWFLVIVFFSLTFVEWFGFLILDIGIPAITAIPLNIRVLSGLFQSIAVRASGFAIVPLQAVAPAVKFLYMVMMYVSAYPIAMSIRSTNVYEQRSLGVYEDVEDGHDNLDPDVDESAARRVRGPKGEVLFSKYLGMHIRRQLSYDLWWLALALFLIMITERAQVMDEQVYWFNQFTVMFELVSAYATVGLSLGIPNQNYSLSGAFKPLSKFIVCLVMLRGRHRDLPQAIDRAILLPHEFTRIRISPEGHHIIDEPSFDPSTAQMTTTSDRPDQAVAEKKE